MPKEAKKSKVPRTSIVSKVSKRFLAILVTLLFNGISDIADVYPYFFSLLITKSDVPR